MRTGVQHLDERVMPAGVCGVYVVAIRDIDIEALPALINGKPVTALAPHPGEDDLFYVTTEHPESLAFLPKPYIDLRP